MTIRTIIAVSALVGALAPGLALARGCDHDRQAQISCADGQSWDDATKSCVVVGS